jgi:hypothetical protein
MMETWNSCLHLETRPHNAQLIFSFLMSKEERAGDWRTEKDSF